MEVSDFKELLNQVRCETIPGLGFTDEDLVQVKSCIDKVVPIEVDDIEPSVTIEDTSCIPAATEELQKVIVDQQKNMVAGIQHGILRAKVQELKDNLDIVKVYYDARFKTLRELLQLSSDQAKLKIQKVESLPKKPDQAKVIIQSAISLISNQLLVEFAKSPIAVNTFIAAFDFRLINRNQVVLKLPNEKTYALEDTVVKIYANPFLTSPIFKKKVSFSVLDQPAYNPDANNNPPSEISDYDFIPGLLYNGNQTDPYLGLYKKFAKPLTYLFTLEERGLTVNPSLIDPNLKSVKDAPTSIKENDVTYYIQNQQTYEDFYGGLKETYPKRVDKERNELYPAAIDQAITLITNLAISEAADIYRKNAGPTSTLRLYDSAVKEIDQLILDCNTQITKLDESINAKIMDEAAITKKILDIPCFGKAGSIVAESDPQCEDLVYQKLGTDPLYLRTMFETNSGLPDIGSQCYWKEFAKALNKVSLLPYPDLSGPPPINTVFRYWPINCIIPAGIALVLLPVPPIWKPLFVIPTPIGTLMCMLSLPIAPIGIPLPSIYLFYFAPDGTKYLILAVNFPQLFSNPTKNLVVGFQLDNSDKSHNPLGLSPTNPYKGYPIKGAFTMPLAATAATAKANRLTKLTADILSGNPPVITNINGGILPFLMPQEQYAQAYLSEAEMMKDIVDAKPTKEFDRQIIQLKSKINKQLDKLGEMQMSTVNPLKQEVRDTRAAAVTEAEKETDLAHRRKAKQVARSLNPIELNEKITSVVSSFNEHIENIKFGTIRFPKDATKYNPGLPEALTSLFDLAELGSVGDFKIDARAKSLNSKIKQAIAKINPTSITNRESFDLESPDDVNEIKSVLNKMVDETIKYLRGDTVSFDVSGAKDKAEEYQIIAANHQLQETARDALAFISVALLNPPKITIFDLSKKCCEVHAKPVFSGVPPELAAAFAILSALMQAIIDGLTPESIAGFIGTESKIISRSFVTTLFDGLVSVIPDVSLPNPANLRLIMQAILIPVLTLISIPKALNPFQPPLIPLVIPLDPIFKPILKALVAAMITQLFKLLQDSHDVIGKRIEISGGTIEGLIGTNGVFAETTDDAKILKEIFSSVCGLGTTVSVTANTVTSTNPGGTISTTGTETTTSTVFTVQITLPDGRTINLPTIPFMALDLIQYFHLLTSADIIEFVRQIINSVFDIILAPLRTVVDLIATLALSFNSFSYNIIEAAIPMLSIIKLARMIIDSKIPASYKLKVMGTDAMNLIQLSIIPALELVEPVLKQVAWIGTTALCAISSPLTNYLPVAVARMVHPIMNCDDLPPWERLTHKNPLFAIFLDEIAWRGSMYATGSLIFQTKTPAALPYTPIFPIVHITPHLT